MDLERLEEELRIRREDIEIHLDELSEEEKKEYEEEIYHLDRLIHIYNLYFNL